MRWGFAGLGLMGAPIAANLVRSGLDLLAYNRTSGPRDALAALGARTCDDPAALFAACDGVILMLANDDAVDAVTARGSPGFAARVAGRLVVNMGTHAPAWSRALADDVAAAGGRFVEAPVSGSRGPAEQGALVAMLAGAAADVAQVAPLLAPVARQVVVTGAVPSAMACKLAVNLYLVASVAALAEAAALGDALGVDPAALAQVIGSGPLASPVAVAKLARMQARDFAPEAAIADVCRNAALVAAAAAGAGLPAPVLAAARDRFEATRAAGHGARDMAAVLLASQPKGEILE